MNCHTSTSLKYPDFHLQPIIKNIPLYVRDNIDFRQKLKNKKRQKNKIPDDSLLVILDVKLLSKYTN